MKRIAVALITLILIVSGFLFFSASKQSSDPKVSLTFLNFTNVSQTVSIDSAGWILETQGTTNSITRQAVFCITNGSKCDATYYFGCVEYKAETNWTHPDYLNGNPPNSISVLAGDLKPRQSQVLIVPLSSNLPWRVHFECVEVSSGYPYNKTGIVDLMIGVISFGRNSRKTFNGRQYAVFSTEMPASSED